MKFGPLVAVIFGFFLIAVYPYYTDHDDTSVLIISDDDNDGITNDKDRCPEENASGKDIDEDGCIDSRITKEEVDYIEKIAKFNLGQYILFAILSLLGTAVYWEREKLKAVLYEEDDLDISKFTQGESTSDLEEEIDYDKLGADKEYDVQTGSFFSRVNLSLSKLNEEADRGTQIICVICIVGLFVALGTVSELPWFVVEGTKESAESSETFEAWHYSEGLEYTIGGSTNQATYVSYESSRCTEEIDKFYNCDYRQSLFGTMNTLLSISLFFCFFALLLAFRPQKYRIWIGAVFSIALVTSMSSLLIFTALIDNALVADSHMLDEYQEVAGGCWMSEPVIWGEASCISLENEGTYVQESGIGYTPGMSFFIVLVCISTLFVGLFTHISPMITREKTTWAEAVRRNWQVFAIIFAIIFLWRLNALMTNL